MSSIVLIITAIMFLSLPCGSHADDSFPGYTVTIDIHQEYQVMDNFGASDCWSMQMIGDWSLENRNRIADLLFSTTEGIGLSCWRFNLGAGKTDDIRAPLRTAETFEVAEGVYDWSRQANEQWFLGAAKARGVGQFIAFVNSPPARNQSEYAIYQESALNLVL